MSSKAEGVDEMDSAFLACRDKGHHWQHLTDKITDGTAKKVREVSRWWQCKGCGTEQEEVFEFPSCEIKARRYVYPDGYLMAKDALGPDRRLNVRDVRREVFGRSGIKF